MKLLCATIVIFLSVTNGSQLPSLPNLGLTTYSNTLIDVPFYGSVNSLQIRNPDVAYNYNYEIPCLFYVTDDILAQFRVSIFKFITGTFRVAATATRGRLAYSPYTAWLSMAAIAEGSEGRARDELFNVLSLPEDRCLRQIFYRLATSREYPSNDVVLGRRRRFVTDSSLYVNKHWENFAKWHTHLTSVSVPFKSNFSELENLKRVFKIQLPDLDFEGNSLLLESLDYHGLWSTLFSDAKIVEEPFYNVNGDVIGTMEFMRISKQVNIGYVDSAKFKVIEIPVGRDLRYKMFMAISYEEDQLKAFKSYKDDFVFEVLSNMKPSPGPIAIAIPRLSLTSELDMRKVLEEMGAKSVWTDPLGTRNISNPAALPSTFIQRVTISIDNDAVPQLQEEVQTPWSIPFSEYAENKEVLRDFIANRPFMVGLFDVETYTLLFCGVYSGPDA